MLKYIDLEYEPTNKDVLCEFKVIPAAGISFEKAARNVALESSIGTWTEIGTLNDRIGSTLKPSVYWMNEKTKEVRIAYPQDLFEAGNMAEIWSSIAGNIFGMKMIDGLRFQDVRFTKDLVNSFKGPRFGIDGIRKIVGVTGRPLTGTIVKPKLGLNEEEHAQVAYESWLGGLDIVKDDENLSSMTFNNFEKRISRTLELRDKAESETGEKKIYMANVTAETNKMIERAEYIKEMGGEYLMVDILTTGWSSLQTLRDADIGLVIHAHRAMHAAYTRNVDHGISMHVVAKSSRLVGMDQLHIGTCDVGKMQGNREAELATLREISQDKTEEDEKLFVVGQDWYGMKTTFPVASGGLHPLASEELVQVMGKNIIAQYGGGCHGHPDGTIAGAKAVRQSIDAAVKGIPLMEYAKDHQELARAFTKWGKAEERNFFK